MTRRLLIAISACLVCLGAGAAVAAPAQADTSVPISHFAAVPSTSQAGGHPDLVVAFNLESRWVVPDDGCNCQDPKDVKVSLPPGLIGNPHATPQCTQAEFALEICASDSQIGAGEFWIFFPWVIPMYNMVPREGEPGLIAFQAPLLRSPQFIEINPRTESDYGLNTDATSINHIVPLAKLRLIFWGVPANPKNDMLRIPAREQHGGGGLEQVGMFCQADGVTPSTDDPNTIAQRCYDTRQPLSSNSPEAPFLQNPTTCGEALTSRVDILSYDRGMSAAESPFPAMTGCDLLSFNPSLSALPTTTQADTASGVDISLSVPQFQSPHVPSPSAIRATTVTLPAGFSINANAADGKVSCTDVEARFGTRDAAQCPEYSKVGTLEIHSAILPGPLPGFIYLGEPQAGNRYRLFLVADGYGVHVKLPGSVRLDPATGQIVADFKNLPQTPFEEFNFHLFGAERGVLATPERCGTYEVRTTFEPWNSALSDQRSKQYFTIDSGPGGTPCPGQPRPFEPRAQAGMADSTAGVHSPFVLDLVRDDGNQNLKALNVATPEGFSGKLAGIPYCSESALQALAAGMRPGLIELASPSCSPESQIGTAVAGVGAGTRPLYVDGKVYLAGPYKGAPLSLVVLLPAVSGPYDLGAVAVRTAIHVDPTTARITAVSDDLPTILDGVPLRVRTIRINLDRPEFTLNPTDCSRGATDVKVFGDEGSVADLSAHFQASNCASLAFKPELELALSTKKRLSHPRLSATMRPRRGDANLSRVAVTLPPSLLLDQAHIGAPCTRAQFAARSCPESSVYGTATAVTPLLDQPLVGPVYLKVSGNKLPDLAVDLRGQVNFNLTGRIDSRGGGLRTVFDVPDVPVSSFTLRMKGGEKGLIQIAKPICKVRPRAALRITGQNGRSANANRLVRAPCGKKAKRAALSTTRKAD